MDDRRDGEHDCGESRHQHGCDQRHSGRGDRGEECGGDRPDGRGGRPETRFLQLEMSQVLYGEAEGVTKQAFRELLVEAAKARLRERFGDKITGLAQLAVDELLEDVRYSLDIEARIQERHQDGGTKDRLRNIFAAGESQPKGRDQREGGASLRKGKR
jgi:hypothetical protein